MTKLNIDNLPDVSGKALQNILTLISQSQNTGGFVHKYDNWTLVSHANKVGLKRDGVTLERDNYPANFDMYLPSISDDDESYGIATFPGMNFDFIEAAKVYLAPAWNSNINQVLRNSFLIGTDTAIQDNRRVSSGIPGWDISLIEIKKLDFDRTAYLTFVKTDGSDEIVAYWTWKDPDLAT